MWWGCPGGVGGGRGREVKAEKLPGVTPGKEVRGDAVPLPAGSSGDLNPPVPGEEGSKADGHSSASVAGVQTGADKADSGRADNGQGQSDQIAAGGMGRPRAARP